MKKELLLAITAICSVVMITACATEDNPPVWEGKTTSLFVASDRHEAGNGNNLAAAIQKVANRNGIYGNASKLVTKKFQLNCEVQQ